MYDMSVDEIITNIMNAGRDLIVEDAVDEYLLAERDIMIEATTAADKMVDLSIDSGFDDESQYLEDDEEINAMLDEDIAEDIPGEDDIFQNTIDELNEDEDMIEDIEDILCPYDDLDALIDGEQDYVE